MDYVMVFFSGFLLYPILFRRKKNKILIGSNNIQMDYTKPGKATHKHQVAIGKGNIQIMN